MKRTLSILMVMAYLLSAGFAQAEEWVCESCGKESTGNFCGQCGAERVIRWICSVCGESNTQNFCTNCGTPKEISWTCPACGTANNTNFCTHCGARKPDAQAIPIATETPAVTSVATPTPVPSPTPDLTSGQCGANAFWSLDDGVLSIKGTGPMSDSLWKPPFNNIRMLIDKVVIYEGITSICETCFYRCSNIESIEIRSEDIEFHKGAFAGCRKLEKLVFTAPIKRIISDREAFRYRWSSRPLFEMTNVVIDTSIYESSIKYIEGIPGKAIEDFAKTIQAEFVEIKQ